MEYADDSMRSPEQLGGGKIRGRVPKMGMGVGHLEVELSWKQIPKVPAFLVQSTFSAESVVITRTERG